MSVYVPPVRVFRVVTKNGDPQYRAGGGSALYDNVRGAKVGRNHFDRSCPESRPHRVQVLRGAALPAGHGVELYWSDLDD